MQSGRRSYVSNRFLLGIALNTVYIVVELFYGFQANSISLIADAVHNSGDVIGLCLTWLSYYMAGKQAPNKFTYGYKNATIFAAFFNAIILFLAVGNLVWISIERFMQPAEVVAGTMMIVATAGVAVNGLTALLFIKDRHKDINIQAIFLNMAVDTAISVSVVLAGALIWWQHWTLIDPAIGLFIAAAVIYSFWGLFKESVHLVLQAVPASINLHDIKTDLAAEKKVLSYHDLHVWPLSTTETALSVHIVTKPADFDPALIYHLSEIFCKKYNIHHTTIQLEVEAKHLPCGFTC